MGRRRQKPQPDTKERRPVVAYLRVSSQEQAEEGLSLETQSHRLRMYAKLNDYNLVAVETDAGRSGGRMDRPALERVLERVETGGATAILVVKLDRLTRSLRDLLWLLDKLDQWDAGVISLGETFDTQTAAGRAMVQMIGVFAEWELATTRERTAHVRARKQENGEHVGGKAPIGYRVAKNEKGVSILVPDDRERQAMKMARELRQRMGCSLQGVADAFNEEGLQRRNGRPWTRQAVARLVE